MENSIFIPQMYKYTFSFQILLEKSMQCLKFTWRDG